MESKSLNWRELPRKFPKTVRDMFDFCDHKDISAYDIIHADFDNMLGRLRWYFGESCGIKEIPMKAAVALDRDDGGISIFGYADIICVYDKVERRMYFETNREGWVMREKSEDLEYNITDIKAYALIGHARLSAFEFMFSIMEKRLTNKANG